MYSVLTAGHVTYDKPVQRRHPATDEEYDTIENINST